MDEFLPQRGPIHQRGELGRTLPRASCVPVVVRCSEVTAKRPEWLWPARIPRGKLTLVLVEPHLTPCRLAVELAALHSRAGGWPDRDANDEPLPAREPATTLLVAGDADLASDIRPRLDAAGADAARVAVLSAVRTVAGESFVDRPVSLLQDLALVENAVAQCFGQRATQCGPCELLLVEASACGNMHEAHSPWGSMAAALADIAQRQRLAVVLVVGAEGSKTQRRLAAKLGAAAAVWVVLRDLAQCERWCFVPVKRPFGQVAPGLALELCDESLIWKPTSNGVVASIHDLWSAGAEGRARFEIDVATDWLVELLGEGEIKSADLFSAARECGVSQRTLQRATAKLGLRPRKLPGDGCWVWGRK